MKVICAWRTQQRVLASFGQCADMPVFNFDLGQDSLENVLTLHAASSSAEGFRRCRAAPRFTARYSNANPIGVRLVRRHTARGFVFMTFTFPNGYGHSCALYFDLPAKRQVFIDPSTASHNVRTDVHPFHASVLELDVTGETVASVLRRRHVWLPVGDGARLEPGTANRGRCPVTGGRCKRLRKPEPPVSLWRGKPM